MANSNIQSFNLPPKKKGRQINLTQARSCGTCNKPLNSFERMEAFRHGTWTPTTCPLHGCPMKGLADSIPSPQPASAPSENPAYGLMQAAESAFLAKNAAEYYRLIRLAAEALLQD